MSSFEYWPPPQVMLYMIVSVLGLTLIVARRKMKAFGEAELGGDKRMKTISAVVLVSLWLLFVLLCTLRAYNVVPNPFSL